jgi:hypothetical protein
MRQATLIAFLTCFFLFRPYQLQNPGLLYGGDDPSYFAYSTALVYGQYPHFDKELVEEGRVPPLGRAGPGLLAAPFVGVFSIIDRVEKNPIVEKRTRETVKDSWSLFGSVFSSAFYFWLSLALIYATVSRLYDSRIATWSTLLMVIAQGAGLYAFVRPIFSHVYELAIQSAFLYLFIRKSTDTKPLPNKTLIPLLIFLSAFTVLVRQNNILYALLWPVLILGMDRGQFIFKSWALTALTVAGGLVSYWVIKNFPFWISPEPYIQVNAIHDNGSFLFELQTPLYYLTRLKRIFLEVDWGLIWTAPFLLVGVAGLFSKHLPFRREFIWIALPLLLSLYILVLWGGQGGWYGYRYLIFAAMPALIVPFAFILDSAAKHKRVAFFALLAWGIIPALSMALFDAAPHTSIGAVTLEFNEPSAGHLTYQLEIWKQAFGHPLMTLYYLCKTGPSFLAYVAVNVLGFLKGLRPIFSKAYPSFEPRVVIQTFLLYLLPWCLFAIGRKLGEKTNTPNPYPATPISREKLRSSSTKRFISNRFRKRSVALASGRDS